MNRNVALPGSYVFGKTVTLSYENAVQRATEALGKEGFGVLTEIDVAATLNKKLGVVVKPYCILGACNPRLAYRALQSEPQIGALLPCNVVVRVDDAGKTMVEFMDPNAVLQLVDRPGVNEIAAEVRARLVRVMDAL
jgi:uncharacterized protein (DUF302 family)